VRGRIELSSVNFFHLDSEQKADRVKIEEIRYEYNSEAKTSKIILFIEKTNHEEQIGLIFS